MRIVASLKCLPLGGVWFNLWEAIAYLTVLKCRVCWVQKGESGKVVPGPSTSALVLGWLWFGLGHLGQRLTEVMPH